MSKLILSIPTAIKQAEVIDQVKYALSPFLVIQTPERVSDLYIINPEDLRKTPVVLMTFEDQLVTILSREPGITFHIYHANLMPTIGDNRVVMHTDPTFKKLSSPFYINGELIGDEDTHMGEVISRLKDALKDLPYAKSLDHFQPSSLVYL